MPKVGLHRDGQDFNFRYTPIHVRFTLFFKIFLLLLFVFNFILYYIILYYIILYFIILYYIILD